MLKKFLIILMIFCVGINLIACEPYSSSPDDDSTSAIAGDSSFVTEDPPTTIRRQNSNTPSDLRMKSFYIDDKIELNASELISAYVSGPDASEYIVDLFQKSSRVYMLPIFGTYLEYTSLAVCLFYSDQLFFGACAVVLTESDNQLCISSELEPILGYIASTFTDSSVYSRLCSCLENCPDFEIMGVVYDEWGLARVYPIGALAGDPTIRYYYDDSTIKHFTFVEPFTSISEGQKAFEDYLEFREQLRSTIPIFEWKTVPLYGSGALSHYKSQETGNDEMQFLFDSDWSIVVPLLDADGNEGRYELHLLCDNDTLIAEMILDREGEGVVLVNKIVSEKDEATGDYLGLTEIKYCSDIEDDLKKIDDYSIIKGVYFNGTNYLLIYND